MNHADDESPPNALWTEWVQASRQHAEGDLPESLVEAGPRVFAASEYLATSCLRAPAMLLELWREGDLEHGFGIGEMEDRLRQHLADVRGEEDLGASLRAFRRRQMVRIIWRDITRTASLDETLEDLTALADACIRLALERLYASLVESEGAPRDAEGVAQPMLVLGMGKLGARELNLSSDIDLIFAFPSDGQTDGRRALSNEQFFRRLGQKLIKALGSMTAEGFVFRVDTRLRPFGDSGPLAASFDFLESYYQSQAREWERYAMIKARVVAGPPDAAESLEQLLRPFVYRRYVDFGAVDSLRRMKAMISDSLRERGMDANIKLGPGGIREIEFIGQAFQLIRGGRDPELQIRPIQQVLSVLSHKGLLPETVVAELTAAYRFLRDVENRIQAWRDEQTHLLPADGPGRTRLAEAMGFSDWPAFEARLDAHRDRVQFHFEALFAEPEEDGTETEPLAAVWQGGEGTTAVEALAQAGYRDPGEVLRILGGFRESRAVGATGERGRQYLERLVPLLLSVAGTTAEPLETLQRVLQILEAVARRTAYLTLLVENPQVLSQLVALTAASPWFAQQVVRQPVLLDEMLDPRALYSPLHRDSLQQEMTRLLKAVDAGDLEQEMERLRQFANINRLRVAAADVTGVIPLMVVSDYLTEIAEVVLDHSLRLAWRDLVARHGRPGGVGADTGFAVIGYGKMGGIELGYGSDLDLVFLHQDAAGPGQTDGDRPLDNAVFYARLGRRIVHILTTRTPSGLLYEVDMRLRPNGNAGLLVSSLNAFDHYQHHSAWTWEHQALIRARFICGDPQVAARFEVVRREVLAKPRQGAALRSDVVEMREKMRASLDRSDAAYFDLKQGRGGIADIEFMVQYLVLRWASDFPDLLRWTDNVRLLETLGAHDLLPGVAAEQLTNMYKVLRSAFHRNALREQPGLVAADQMLAERELVAEMWREILRPASETNA